MHESSKWAQFQHLPSQTCRLRCNSVNRVGIVRIFFFENKKHFDGIDIPINIDDIEIKCRKLFWTFTLFKLDDCEEDINRFVIQILFIKPIVSRWLR